MSGKTAIGWVNAPNFIGASWNVGAYGCDPVSEGCGVTAGGARVGAQCYAQMLTEQRFAGVDPATGNWRKTGKPAPFAYRQHFTDVRLMNPASVDRQGRSGVLSAAAWEKKLNWPKTLREPHMIFVNSMLDWLHSDIPVSDIRAVLDVCRACPQHIFILLTKRAGRLRHLGPQLDWPTNVWPGVSIEMDKYARGRRDALVIGAAQASVRLISAEPLLSGLPSLDLAGVDWLIVGAQSGRGALPMELDWARALRDKAQTAGTAFFLKQIADEKGRKIEAPELDGRQWLEWPEVRR